MRKLLYIAAAFLTFAASDATGRKSGDKIQVVYREQPTGEWQMFVFGASCPTHQNMQVIYPKDPTQPIEIECDNQTPSMANKIAGEHWTRSK